MLEQVCDIVKKSYVLSMLWQGVIILGDLALAAVLVVVLAFFFAGWDAR